MRETKLYTLNEQVVLTYPTAEFLRIRLDQWLEAGDEMVMLTEKTEDVPIHMISKIEYGQRKDEFIALDSELQAIIEAPFIHRTLQAEKQFEGTKAELRSMLDKVNHFNSLPWYKRIFKKI
jgi:hypothetical protein